MNERTTAEIMADLRGKRSLFQAQRDEAADRLEALDRLFTAVHKWDEQPNSQGRTSYENGRASVIIDLRGIR
jgi:hypothetical protein